MTESTFSSSTVCPILSMFGEVRRVENRIGKGTPDIVCCIRRDKNSPAVTAWIETKHAYEWPKRADTPLRFNHFEIEQVRWAEAWDRVDGRYGLLCQVEHDYLLFGADMAQRVHDGMIKADLLSAAVVRGYRSFPTSGVVKWLTR